MSTRAVPADTTRDRVVTAALQCLTDEGLRRTTVDDIAAAAGISRATLYRAFPGGRDTILACVVDVEFSRLISSIATVVAGADDLRDALVDGLHAAAVWLSTNRAIETLMFDEPAVLLTHVEFEQMDQTLAAVAARVAPLLERFVTSEVAERVGEWATRLVVSYSLFPSDDIDLCERAGAELLVDRHVLPGVAALAAEPALA